MNHEHLDLELYGNIIVLYFSFKLIYVFVKYNNEAKKYGQPI